ncbi:hypothetical protein M8A51_06065 [Schlegelella sp. S2-27]|uniref:Universal stress protein family protein n=1 Tax=Caldimonas mangrovi TaxID=2944811 RepID=A0ABT0YK65_9BURK|nr:hypothetical protein [Caldimonas mangrovi]MCM5679095.1 hypothetical protein [Caldimonas mangrovi]
MKKKVAVLLDDAAHAQDRLAPRLHQTHDVHWVLVACAPRMTHRASKWVSHGAREHWRSKWAAKLFAQMQPWLDEHGLEAEPCLAKGPLPELMQQLTPDEVIDVRRPKLAGAEATGFRLPSFLVAGVGLWFAMAEA